MITFLFWLIMIFLDSLSDELFEIRFLITYKLKTKNDVISTKNMVL